MATGSLPTGIVVTTVAELASISLTVLSPALATHTSVPSDEIATGSLPTGIVATTVWELVSISLTVLSVLLATQTSVPSEEMAVGAVPTGIGEPMIAGTWSNSAAPAELAPRPKNDTETAVTRALAAAVRRGKFT
jgi:hypothetical protein